MKPGHGLLVLAINQESEGHHDGRWLIHHPEVQQQLPMSWLERQ
jgi:hypothetical protein